ncbi:MAG: acyl-CoA dehydrogenase family protein, partial [Rhodospirillaceae bacterium]|nr:acyl-CoA dehydrogenase family protein [Rhodospirillaceae bacterium]
MVDVSAADFDALRPPSPFLKPEHAAWRDKLRGFIDAEITPHLSAWEKTGTFPDDLYTKAVTAGVYGMGFAAAYGGVLENADLYHRIIFAEEFHRHGSGLVYCDLATYSIAVPPLVASGHPDVIAKFVKPILAGEIKTAFAVTESTGGSDVAGFQTTAERKGDGYVLNGSKALISSAMRADMALVVARTGGPGIGGLSLLWVDLRHPGVTRAPAPGLGWYNANIGTLNFKDVPVPVTHLVGKENEGFMSLGPQLSTERFSGVAAMLAMARAATAEAIAWAKERQAFGKRLADQQV